MVEKHDFGKDELGIVLTGETETVEITRVFAKVTGSNRREIGRIEKDSGNGFNATSHHTKRTMRWGSRQAAIDFIFRERKVILD